MPREKAWFSFFEKPAKLKLGKNETTAISLSYEISIIVITIIEEVHKVPFIGWYSSFSINTVKLIKYFLVNLSKNKGIS